MAFLKWLARQILGAIASAVGDQVGQARREGELKRVGALEVEAALSDARADAMAKSRDIERQTPATVKSALERL